jgi:hypothetical protein
MKLEVRPFFVRLNVSFKEGVNTLPLTIFGAKQTRRASQKIIIKCPVLVAKAAT